jgi:hypothetical protein
MIPVPSVYGRLSAVQGSFVYPQQQAKQVLFPIVVQPRIDIEVGIHNGLERAVWDPN